MATAILLALLLGPIVLIYLLRANAAMAFLSLAAASAASTFCSDGLSRLIERLAKVYWSPTSISMFMILLAFLLTLLFTYKTVVRAKMLVHVVPALAAGGLLALLLEPLFNSSLQAQVSGSAIWQDLVKVQAIVVGAGVLASLLLIWLAGVVHPRKKHH